MTNSALAWQLAFRLASLVSLIAAPAQSDPAGSRTDVEFRLPIDCRVGETCFVQNWIDMDPGPGRADPHCGPLTYNGHDGLDFRISMRAFREGVTVLAPADGIVKALRDGVPDVAYRPEQAAALAGHECGNGIILDHGGGLETQFCHMARGSVLVRRGDSVKAGQSLGKVGMSGAAEFPHLHFSVRRNGKKLDPFFNRPIGEMTCQQDGALPKGLWAVPPVYNATAIIDAGFLNRAPSDAQHVDEGQPATGQRDASQLIGWALVMGPHAGDEIHLRILNPNTTVLAEQRVTQQRDQAQFVLFTGKRRTSSSWPAGKYSLDIEVRRGDTVAAQRSEFLMVR